MSWPILSRGIMNQCELNKAVCFLFLKAVEVSFFFFLSVYMATDLYCFISNPHWHGGFSTLYHFCQQ